MLTAKEAKRESIRRILSNETYLPESGLMEMLAKHLSKIPADVLHGLEAVLACKPNKTDCMGGPCGCCGQPTSMAWVNTENPDRYIPLCEQCVKQAINRHSANPLLTQKQVLDIVVGSSR